MVFANLTHDAGRLYNILRGGRKKFFFHTCLHLIKILWDGYGLLNKTNRILFY